MSVCGETSGEREFLLSVWLAYESVARRGQTCAAMPAKAMTASSSLNFAASRPRSTAMPGPLWSSVLIADSLIERSALKGKVFLSIALRGRFRTEVKISFHPATVQLLHTLEGDDTGPNRCNLGGIEMYDVFRRLQIGSAPDHRSCHSWGERVGGGEAALQALQALHRRPRTEARVGHLVLRS